jgi:5-methylcytosine-specific restriction endonuclease McrA
MPAYRQCRRCLAKVPMADFKAHQQSHSAEPPRKTRMVKPCRRCDPPQLIAGADWVAHLQQHANSDPSRPRSRSGTYKWQQLRKRVLARDGNRCTNCGRTTDLQVHHLDPGTRWRDHSTPDAELVPISQLVTLCRDCHDLA